MYQFIAQEKANHSVKLLCRLLEVSRSGYYGWYGRGPSARERADAELTEQIKAIHQQSRGTYGAPRIHAELRDGQHIHCACKRVARLMRQAGLEGVHRRKYKGSTRRDPKRDPYPDLVERQFRVCAPNQLWVADVTQHETAEGWLYLAVIIDAYSRLAVGWAMSERFTVELVLSALEMALWKRQPEGGVIHHSDHGSQYTSLVFGARLERAGLLGSMGTVGDALDNALAESFFATLQTELLDRYQRVAKHPEGRAEASGGELYDWPTRQGLRSAIFEFIEVFYNRQRRHSRLGYLSPVAFERLQRVA